MSSKKQHDSFQCQWFQCANVNFHTLGQLWAWMSAFSDYQLMCIKLFKAIVTNLVISLVWRSVGLVLNDEAVVTTIKNLKKWTKSESKMTFDFSALWTMNYASWTQNLWKCCMNWLFFSWWWITSALVEVFLQLKIYQYDLTQSLLWQIIFFFIRTSGY